MFGVAVLGHSAAPRWTASAQVNSLLLLAVLWFLCQLCLRVGALPSGICTMTYV